MAIERKNDQTQKSEDTKEIMRGDRLSNDKSQIRNPIDINDDKHLESHWEKIREPFKMKYPDLNDDDLHYDQGEFGQMLDRIGSKTGLSATQLRHKILNWEDSPFHNL